MAKFIELEIRGRANREDALRPMPV